MSSLRVFHSVYQFVFVILHSITTGSWTFSLIFAGWLFIVVKKDFKCISLNFYLI